ncbi:hypothetical protein AB4Y96_14580 [Phyllobacterium sp. TAF24]|uniref:hypothetical protein n=1 Tax=Phyllobacterium sp. TAF24 TaxID=3233068 RepID=UPI003F9C1300
MSCSTAFIHRIPLFAEYASAERVELTFVIANDVQKSEQLIFCINFSNNSFRKIIDLKGAKVARVTGLEPATSGVTGR